MFLRLGFELSPGTSGLKPYYFISKFNSVQLIVLKFIVVGRKKVHCCFPGLKFNSIVDIFLHLLLLIRIELIWSRAYVALRYMLKTFQAIFVNIVIKTVSMTSILLSLVWVLLLVHIGKRTTVLANLRVKTGLIKM